MLEQVTREVTVEALPNDIPESLELDVSAMEINDTFTLAQSTAPPGVTILDDPTRPWSPPSPRRASDRGRGRDRDRDRGRRRGGEPGEGEAAERGDGGDDGGGAEVAATTASSRAAVRSSSAASRRSTGWWSASATPAPLRGHAAQRRLRRRPALIDRWDLGAPQRSSTALLAEGRAGPAARAWRCCCRRRT